MAKIGDLKSTVKNRLLFFPQWCYYAKQNIPKRERRKKIEKGKVEFICMIYQRRGIAIHFMLSFCIPSKIFFCEFCRNYLLARVRTSFYSFIKKTDSGRINNHQNLKNSKHQDCNDSRETQLWCAVPEAAPWPYPIKIVSDINLTLMWKYGLVMSKIAYQ